MKNRVVVAVFCVAILSGFFWNSKIFGSSIDNDQTVYDQVARNILYFHDYSFNGREAFVEPVYPFFLAGVYGIFGHSFDAVRVIQIIIFAVSSVIFLKLAHSLFSKKMALFSALGVATFYGLATTAGIIGPSTIFIFFVLLLTATIIEADRSQKKAYWSLAGIIAGLATLTVGSLEFLPIFIVANLFILYWKKDMRQGLARVALFILCFTSVLAFWSLRPSGHVDRNIIAPRKGFLLLAKMEIANNVYVNVPGHFMGHLFGYYIAEKFYSAITPNQAREAPRTEEKFRTLESTGMDYYTIDEELFDEAKMQIAQSPEKFAFGAVLNFVTLNSPLIPKSSNWQSEVYVHPMFTTEGHSKLPGFVKVTLVLAIRTIWWLFFAFVIYAAARIFHPGFLAGWTTFGWVFVVIGYFNLFYTLSHGLPRYALPVYPLYIMLSSFGVVQWIKNLAWYKKRKGFNG